MAGPFLLASKTAVFLEKWESELVEWNRVLNSLRNAEETDAVKTKKEQLNRYIELIGKVLAT